MKSNGLEVGAANLEKDSKDLIKIAAQHLYLPNKHVVKTFEGALFPAIRGNRELLQKHKVSGNFRGQTITFPKGELNQEVVLDDNTTPRWALLWSHGWTKSVRPKGWLFAHVWADSQNPDTYTHLANLVMIAEPLAALTDKNGPLAAHLRYHAWFEYSFSPNGQAVEKPNDYRHDIWQYLDKPEKEPLWLVTDRLKNLNNARVKAINSIRAIERTT